MKSWKYILYCMGKRLKLFEFKSAVSISENEPQTTEILKISVYVGQ